MNDRWSRRALLASVGAAAVAGCTGDGGPAETDTSPRKPTATDTRTATETSTRAESTPEPPASVDSEWPVPGGDPGRSNGVDAEGPIDPVSELWTIRVETDLSSPVVANETVYVGGADGTILALDARNGERRWKASVGAAAGTPHVRNDTVYVPRGDWIVALDADDGTERWRIETGPRAQMLVAPHGLYSIGDRESAAVARYSLDDGTERWRTVVERCGVWPGYAIAGSDVLYVSTGHTHRFPWVVSVETGKLRTNPAGCITDADEIRFYRDGAVVGVNPMGGQVVVMNESAAEEKWRQRVNLDLTGVCGDSQRVYVATSLSEDAGLAGLSLETGPPGWSIEKQWRPRSRPVVAERCLLCKSDLGLHCFDPADGTERWTRPAEGVGDEFVVADDLIYTTKDRTIRAFR